MMKTSGASLYPMPPPTGGLSRINWMSGAINFCTNTVIQRFTSSLISLINVHVTLHSGGTCPCWSQIADVFWWAGPQCYGKLSVFWGIFVCVFCALGLFHHKLFFFILWASILSHRESLPWVWFSMFRIKNIFIKNINTSYKLHKATVAYMFCHFQVISRNDLVLSARKCV